jgi:ferrochelatase
MNNLHVICPGFSSDCLETLEEINMEGKSIFINNGGKNYKYIPALNSDPHWIEAMGQISSSNLQGWLDPKWSLSQEQKSSNVTKKQAEKFK